MTLHLHGDEQNPSELRRIIEKRDRAVNRIDAVFLTELEKLKSVYMKRSDLDSANKVESLIKATRSKLEKRDVDRKEFLSNVLSVKWEWQHKSDKTSWFILNPNGTVELNWTDKTPINWKTVGSRKIRITFPSNEAVVTLTWNEKYERYTGLDFNQKTGLKIKMWGKRVNN